MRRRHSLPVLLLMLPLLGAAGCGPSEADPGGAPMPGDVPPDPALDTLPMDTLPGDTVRTPADTAAIPDTTEAPPDTMARPSGPAAIEGLATVHPWTAGIVDEPDPEAGVVTVTSVEVEALPDMDRIVVTMDGTRPPGYHVEYVDSPVYECGSGRAIHPPGDGWLQLRLSAARGHTEAGEATLTRQMETPNLGVVRRIDRTCDFEAVVALVLSVSSPNAYRLSVAENPNRLVLDVRHERSGGSSSLIRPAAPPSAREVSLRKLRHGFAVGHQ